MIDLSQLARIVDIEYHEVLAGACQIYHGLVTRRNAMDINFSCWP